MAEFAEVMKQWRRMCKKLNGECTQFCSICSSTIRCGNIINITDEQIDGAEAEILKWAKENPEPIYPTWVEWLTEIDVLSSSLPLPNIPFVAYYGGAKMQDHIPANIAKKFGIKPINMKEE